MVVPRRPERPTLLAPVPTTTNTSSYCSCTARLQPSICAGGLPGAVSSISPVAQRPLMPAYATHHCITPHQQQPLHATLGMSHCHVHHRPGQLHVLQWCSQLADVQQQHLPALAAGDQLVGAAGAEHAAGPHIIGVGLCSSRQGTGNRWAISKLHQRITTCGTAGDSRSGRTVSGCAVQMCWSHPADS